MSKVELQNKTDRTKTISAEKLQGVMVLGMHRSGTSACTRVLNLMGCALPDNLLGSGDGNETGHWESYDVVALNDEMLTTAGSDWADWGAINADWRESAIRKSMVTKAIGVINDHAVLGPLFAVKDPRFCRLADVWIDAMTDAAVEPLVLIMLRNPKEVEDSLENRDLMAPEYGQLLWLRHVLDAEYLTRGQRRTFCRYDQLLTNWQGMMSRIKSDLGIVFPRNSPSVHAKVDEFLSVTLKHHNAEPQSVLSNPGYSEWLQRTFAIMLEWSEAGENHADHSELDTIRREFDRAYVAFSRLVMTEEIKGKAGDGSRLKRELNVQLEETQRAAETVKITLQQAESKTTAALAHAAELAAKLAAEAIHAEEFQSEIAKLQTEVARLTEVESEAEQLRLQEAELAAKLAAEAIHAEKFQSEIAKLQTEVARLSKVESEIAQLTHMLREQEEAMQTALATKSDEVEQLRLHEAELAAKLSVAESTLNQRQEELTQNWNQILSIEKALAEASANEAQERERRQEGDKRVATAEAELSNLRSDIGKSSLATTSMVEKFVSEIAQLTRMLREQEEAMQTAAETKSNKEMELEAQSVENSRLADQIHQLAMASQQAETARSTIEKKLAARFDEIARMTAMLADESRRVTSAQDDLQWLRDVQRVANGFPSWWVLLRDDKRRKREHQRYHRAGLFDARRYLDRYPDVAENGMDPVRHYILHGMAEGRQRTTPS